MIREIDSKLITEAVAELSVKANKLLPEALSQEIENAAKCEKCELARDILCDLKRNEEAAKKLDIPICQDTGMAVVFAEIGMDVHIVGDSFEDAVNKGVKKGYCEGYLRKSVVKDPFNRINTEDNTPAIIHTRLVCGDKIKLTVAPKGFGSENMSRMYMLTPAATEETIVEKVLETVRKAGGNPCPPIVVGVGIGGDFEYCALLSKKALLREIGEHNPDPFYERLEKRLLEEVNKTGIGPQGFGGDTTALFVAVEQFPTHIAGLPLAVNIGCHVTRHKTLVI